MRKVAFLLLIFLSISNVVIGQSNKVSVEKSSEGWELVVDGEAQFVKGMNWDYYPIGTNYSYNFWSQSESFIERALNYEMKLLQDMGANAIRVYTGIPKKWITYIYENFGIYTMLNHSFGRYGLSIEGEWVANVDYADERVREILLNEVEQLVSDYKDTPGLLLYLLGNENNYGLFWKGAETENIPGESEGAEDRARAMYKLFNEAALTMKSIDTNRPIALCNGDLQFLEIIAEEVPDVDIFGTNTYRGKSFTGLFDRLKNEYGKPVLLTEFGSDALNAQNLQLNQQAQAWYLKENWKEIYANAAGMGEAANALGGFTFQFSDGWWKYDQNKNLKVHDTHASWTNGGYEFDYIEGENNMNEEWFGITAKGLPDSAGFYRLAPRTAYYVLKEAHEFDPYAEKVNEDSIANFFNQISIEENHRLSCNASFSQRQEDENWELVWSDEFNEKKGTSPDSTKWTYDIGNGWHGWGNQELQYYTDRPENVSTDGSGNLVITAKKEKRNEFEYTSSRIKTLGLFEQAYGRFEARIKLPEGQGIWPAFWMLGADFPEVGWPETGEIDMMELRGQYPSVVSAALHGPGYSKDHAITKYFELPAGKFSSEFHLFAAEWYPDRIEFYVDDCLYQVVTKQDVETQNGEWVYDKPFFLLLNVAVGGNYVGPPSDETSFPQQMVIDYVRVYRQ